MSVQLSPDALALVWVRARLRERLPMELFDRITEIEQLLDHRRYMTRFVIRRKEGRLMLRHPEFDAQDFKELRPGLTFMLPEEELARLVLFLS